MKKVMMIVAVFGAMLSAGGAYAEDSGGANPNGNEKVCFVSANGQSEPGLSEALKSCKRGDVLDIGWLQLPAAMQLCDFTKTVLYHPTKNNIVACVYTGTRRPTVK